MNEFAQSSHIAMPEAEGSGRPILSELICMLVHLPSCTHYYKPDSGWSALMTNTPGTPTLDALSKLRTPSVVRDSASVKARSPSPALNPMVVELLPHWMSW